MNHRFNVNFSDQAWTEIERATEELGITHSEVIREALSLFVMMKDDIKRGDDYLHLHAGDELPMLIEIPYFERLRPPRPPRGGILERLMGALRRIPPVAADAGA